MNPINIPALAQRAHPVVQIHDGQAITISTEVARVFSKQHKDVLRAIQNLRSDLPENNRRNFALVDYTDEKGERRPAYHLTRDGFTLLAMGFTGKRALAFKLAYIDAFNKMEAALLESSPAQPAPAQKALPISVSEPARRPYRASSDMRRRIEDVVFLMAQLQRELTRRILTHAVHEAVTGNTHWRGQRWLLRLADDDLGQPTVPHITELAADATIAHIVSPAQTQTPPKSL